MSSTSAPQNRLHFEPWRIFAFYAAIAIVVVIFVTRLVNLQIIQNSEWNLQAVDNRTRTISVQSLRGIIYDRNGFILARNVASYNIVIVPASLPEEQGDIQRIYRELSAVIQVPVNQGTVEDAKLVSACTPGPGIVQLVALGESLAPYSPIRIRCNVDDVTARLVRERAVDWPGVSVEIEPVRDYPTGSLTATVVGFLGPIPATLVDEYEELGFDKNRDKIGYSGVELSMESMLRGQNGKRVVEIDVAGQEIRNLEAPISPVAGNNVTLTIDSRLQQAAEASLISEINFWDTYFGQVRISSGVVIAMNPQTGEILAMVSYPSYENNRMARFIPAYYYNQLSEDPRKPLINHAISDELPPGSVFKLSTATGALNEGVVTLDQVIETPGAIVLCERFSPNEPCTERNQRPFVDWIYERNGIINAEGFGRLNFLNCIANSSNVCFYKLGGGFEDEIEEGLGILRLAEYARALGYDEVSGIELPGEEDGLIPSPRWKRQNLGENWSTGDTYIASVGQGYVLSTPLQVLMSAATIANSGRQMVPTIIREITDPDGQVVRPFQPKLRWDITATPMIKEFNCDAGFCLETGNLKVVDPFVVQKIQEGMRMAVLDGTLTAEFSNVPIAVAGKTGTAEYCDDVARSQNRCDFGLWPTHAWTVAYAPYENPEIVVLAFAYNGGEGGSVAAPIVRRVIEAYFELKSIDISKGLTGGG